MEKPIKTERLKLPGTANSPEEAENIFKDIEEKTGAKIQWESCKFTNTYKRDPVIKLCGTPDAVKTAREMILQNLEIQSNRIILKMDITHEEHPSLINKKGCLIKKVMQETNCHIHFPDGNKIPVNEKSNQVSITGEPINVERARVMLRALLPFQVIFQIDKSSFQLVNISSPLWIYLEQTYGLDVHFIQNKKFVSVVVRCSQERFPSLRQQILCLMEFLTGKRGSDLPLVKVLMDIMPQHHGFVKGPKGSNIQEITKRTGAKIYFPNSETNERRAINITGNLDCVYVAWQEIMSSLPINVAFDVSENRETKSDYTNFLLDCNISVNCRLTPRCHVKSISVRGPERFSKQILQYRQRVLNVPPIRFNTDMEDINKAFTILNALVETQRSQNVKNLSTFTSGTNNQLDNLVKNIHANCFQGIENQIIQALLQYNTTLCPQVTYNTDAIKNIFDTQEDYYISSSPTDISIHAPPYIDMWRENLNNNEAVMINCPEKSFERTFPVKKAITTDHIDISSDVAFCKEKSENKFEIFEKKLRAHQAIHRNIESTQVPSSLWAGYGFSQSMPSTVAKEEVDVSSRYSCISLESSSSCSSEDTWESIVLADYIDDKIWSNKEENAFSMSNVFDFKRHSSLCMNFGSKDILPRLLNEEGLYSYVDTFLREEIDYAAFLLLNEYDLQKLKIPYQARMKITCLIRELQDSEMKRKTFNAAPGAGRKSINFQWQ